MLLTCISDPSEEHAEIGTEKCRKNMERQTTGCNVLREDYMCTENTLVRVSKLSL